MNIHKISSGDTIVQDSCLPALDQESIKLDPNFDSKVHGDIIVFVLSFTDDSTYNTLNSKSFEFFVNGKKSKQTDLYNHSFDKPKNIIAKYLHDPLKGGNTLRLVHVNDESEVLKLDLPSCFMMFSKSDGMDLDNIEKNVIDTIPEIPAEIKEKFDEHLQDLYKRNKEKTS